MAYSTGWDDPQDAPEPRSRGLADMVKTALWAAAGLGAIVIAVMGAYSLGVRDAEHVVAMKGAVWRSKPADPGGSPVPGAESPAYSALGPAAVDPATGLRKSGAPERPTAADAAAAKDRVALADAPPVEKKSFLDLVSKAVETPEASTRRRTVELAPAKPRESAAVKIGPEREDLPPNAGPGSPPTPPATAAYRRPGSAPADTPPEAEAAALDERALTPPGRSMAPKPVETAAAAPKPATPPKPVEIAPAARKVETTATAPVRRRPAGPAMFQVQLAALDSVDAVEKRWSSIKKRHSDILGGHKLDIQPFNVDKLRLYRLRVGNFTSRAEASELCKALSSRGVDCFPTTR
ncbi:MAG: SPOR domain-containing protein [Neomegalonema sp.]|nr:SPOR domain-containing protein [Neomegalonema sp.]